MALSPTRTIGVLALQGDFRRHLLALEATGWAAREVRTPADLLAAGALVLPGGESTTMSLLLDSSALFGAVQKRLVEGMPAFGTCAGMILLGGRILGGKATQRSFGALDIDVRRNAFGPQVESFETDLDIAGMEEGPFRGVFIRAPIVERVGPGVEVLARVAGRPVLCREGVVLAAAFHPELTGDDRLHQLFAGIVQRALDGSPGRR